MTHPFEFRAVFTAQERLLVAKFWSEQFRDTAPYLQGRPNEHVWMDYSHIFAGFHEGQVVAACRLSPYHPELGWEASEDLDESHLAAIDRVRCVQLNRVAVRPDARNWHVHEHMFYALSQYMLEYTAFDGFFSLVREPLVRLYRPWAIHSVSQAPIVLPSRGQHKYVIVRGDVAVTHQRLSSALDQGNTLRLAPGKGVPAGIHCTQTHTLLPLSRHDSMSDIPFEDRLAQLEQSVAALWSEILASSRLAHAIQEGKIDKALYAIYMIETYHYTAHNARNQALVGVRHAENVQYAKFCFEHAAEEVGHEKMALHDVMSIGLKQHDIDIPEPLPATEILIAYLYWISFTGNPLQRLGYSYWAENAYQYINPLINGLRETLELQPSQLTFFIAHSDIDSHHFEEIKSIMKRTCRTDRDWADIARVMETSLRLTGAMLEASYDEYVRYRAGASGRYKFLDVLEGGHEVPAEAGADAARDHCIETS